MITGARVYTAEPFDPWAEAVLTAGNRLTYVGGEAEARELAPSTVEEIHVPGGLVVPGFNDSHIHLGWGGHALTTLNLEDVTQPADLQSRLRTFAGDHPERPWIQAYGLRYEVLMPLHVAPREVIDRAVADRPVFIRAFDYHSAWCNSEALRRARIERGADVSAPNEVIVDPESGLATGLLKERGAHTLVSSLIPEAEGSELEEQLCAAMRHVNRFGVTSVQNMHGDAEELERYARLLDTGRLTVRASHYLNFRPYMSVELLRGFADLRDRFSGRWNRVTGVKLFLDGVVESKTALMLEPYADGSGDRGRPDIDLDLYRNAVDEADRLKLDVATHAVGDAAVRIALDAYDRVRLRTRRFAQRHRIEHIEVLDPDDRRRFFDLEVTASMQPLHATLSSEDPRENPWLTLTGRDRWPRAFPWIDLKQSGAHLCFGSDWPVMTCDVRAGLRAAVTRTGPDGLPRGGWQPQQCITLAQALNAYTRTAAYAERELRHKGMLQRGMLADVAVFEHDLFALDPSDWTDVDIVLTVVDGRIVHSATA